VRRGLEKKELLMPNSVEIIIFRCTESSFLSAPIRVCNPGIKEGIIAIRFQDLLVLFLTKQKSPSRSFILKILIPYNFAMVVIKSWWSIKNNIRLSI
jgi:hypothetical protein